MATDDKKKSKKKKESVEEELVQINIFTDEETREIFRRLCQMRGWTHGQGLAAVMRFLEDVRNKPKNASTFLTKHGLNKISE